MTLLTGYDASEPPANPPQTDVVAFYIGGDTPHVWTKAEIEAQPARYRLPIWVRSNPVDTIAAGASDALGCALGLGLVGCPSNVFVALDLETAVAPSFVDGFGGALEHMLTMVYGSLDYVFKNPMRNGYWVAQPPDTTFPPGAVGIQYGQGGGGAYDLDLFLDIGRMFWDTAPPAPPKELEDMTTWSDLKPDGTVALRHVAGVVNGVAYHWWQPPGGNTTGPKWNVEVLPLS